MASRTLANVSTAPRQHGSRRGLTSAQAMQTRQRIWPTSRSRFSHKKHGSRSWIMWPPARSSFLLPLDDVPAALRAVHAVYEDQDRRVVHVALQALEVREDAGGHKLDGRLCVSEMRAAERSVAQAVDRDRISPDQGPALVTHRLLPP